MQFPFTLIRKETVFWLLCRTVLKKICSYTHDIRKCRFRQPTNSMKYRFRSVLEILHLLLGEKHWKRYLLSGRGIKIYMRLWYSFYYTNSEKFYFTLSIHSSFTRYLNSTCRNNLTNGKTWVKCSDKILCFRRFIGNKNTYKNDYYVERI